jgi:hypothetical protein
MKLYGNKKTDPYFDNFINYNCFIPLSGRVANKKYR